MPFIGGSLQQVNFSIWRQVVLRRLKLYNHKYVKRKSLILGALLLPGVLLGFLFYPACGAGFVLSKYCSGKRDGERGKVRSIIIPVPRRDCQIHLHHWFLSSLAGVISVVTGFFVFSPALFLGFISGLVFQGIFCYGDWHRIITKRKPFTVLDEALLLACEQQESVTL
ncbi:MAG: hypothetical protein HYX84_00860 [Chloroflexi bacterium]|nr:hypothetical protein [Chloroflexota bacterium]